LPHHAAVRPLLSAAMVILSTCCLLALAYGVARLFRRFGAAANIVVELVFGAATGAAIAGLIGIPVVILGPVLTSLWQVVAYFGWLFVLAILASATLVPLFFARR
jgi:hypothetical protein